MRLSNSFCAWRKYGGWIYLDTAARWWQAVAVYSEMNGSKRVRSSNKNRRQAGNF